MWDIRATYDDGDTGDAPVVTWGAGDAAVGDVVFAVARSAAGGTRVTWIVGGDTTSFKAKLVAPMVQAKLRNLRTGAGSGRLFISPEMLDFEAKMLITINGSVVETAAHTVTLLLGDLPPGHAVAVNGEVPAEAGELRDATAGRQSRHLDDEVDRLQSRPLTSRSPAGTGPAGGRRGGASGGRPSGRAAARPGSRWKPRSPTICR